MADSPVLAALLSKLGMGPYTHQTAEPVGKPSTLADFIMMLRGYPENYVNTGSMDPQLWLDNPAAQRETLGIGGAQYAAPPPLRIPPKGAKPQ